MIDQQLLAKVINENLEWKINKCFVESGQATPNIQRFISFISELFRYNPPDNIDWDFCCVITNSPLDCSIGEVLHRRVAVTSFNQTKYIFLIDDNNCLLCNRDIVKVPDFSLVYKFYNKVESIIANGSNIDIINPESATCSIFALPTFKDLDEALWQYNDKKSKFSMCNLVSKCWIESQKLRFVPGPEHNLRDSLYIFLRDCLRGNPEVKREQNVDELNPVDIKVTWKYTNAVALIEIKWLGISFDKTTKKKTQEFHKSRAISGAKQLRRYIRSSIRENPEIHFQGFLVVFDGRRKNIRNFDSIPSYEQVNFYKNNEIEYPISLKNDPLLRLNYRFFIESDIDAN